MASKVVSAFNGPITPTALEAWLGQCEDGFAIYTSTKSDKTPDLDVPTKIRLTGTHLHEPSMAAWWNANRKEFLKLASWDALEKQIRSRFMPKGYKLMALRSFFLCSQGKSTFSDYAATLAEARNGVGPSIISASIYKYQLLFHAHPILVLRIVAIPDFDIDSIGFDDLVALMNMQFESLAAEGNLGRLLITARASPAPLSSATRLPFLDDTERDRLSAAKGCWRCRKIPTDAGWVPHVGRTCPGDAANGVQPGRDFVPGIKTEIAAGIFLAADTSEDQPEYDADEYSNAFYAADDSDSE